MSYPAIEAKGLIYNEQEKITLAEQLNEIENDIIYSRLEIETIDKLKKELLYDEYYYIKSTELRSMRKLYNDDIFNLKYIRNALTYFNKVCNS
jgi:hypothetical protein